MLQFYIIQRRAIYDFVKHNTAFLSDNVFVASMVGHFMEHFMMTVELVLLRTDTIPALFLLFQFFQPFYGGK